MNLTKLFATLAASGLAFAANADLTLDFNTGVDHVEKGTWVALGPNGSGAMFSAATTAGWTTGIKIGFYGDKDTIAGIAASNPNAYIHFDLTIDHSLIPTATADWYQVAVGGNSGAGGWHQFENLISGWHGAGRTDMETKTVSLTFAQIGWGATPDWGYNLEFISNTGAAVLPLYLDNLVVVPEPATASVLTLGLVTLFVLRRKR